MPTEPMDPATVSLSWQAIAVLALTSGLVTAIVSSALDWVRSSRTQKRAIERDARYLAVRLATALEKFAIDCADVVERNDAGERLGVEPANALPTFPEFPTDADWKALEPNLAAGVLSMPNELKIGDLTAHEALQITGDIEHAREIISDHAGKCGHRSLVLSSRLRTRYGLPEPDFGPRMWEFEANLKRHHDLLADRASPDAASAPDQETPPG